MSIIKFLKTSGYNLSLREKKQVLLPLFKDEHQFHYDNNDLYKRIIDNEYESKELFQSFETIPMLPVSYFKYQGDSFTTSKNIHRSLQSSSTSGTPSIVNIDKETSKRQVLSLTSSLSRFVGKERRPFMVCDVPQQSKSFDISARHGAISGFTNFSTKTDYILDEHQESYKLNIDRIKHFINSNSDEPIILCGFTYLIYIYLAKYCIQNNITFSLPKDSYVIHIGGWKKLSDEKVNPKKFNDDVAKILGISPKNIIDVYGFTEQMGTVYPECEFGHKHVPDHAHLIVRDAYSHEVIQDGQIGVGQFLSLVPKSYVGYSLLTDDLVRTLGHDDCKCGRKGTYFEIIGRAKSAEVRGCGDVIANKLLDKTIKKTNTSKAKLYFTDSKMCDIEIEDWSQISFESNNAHKELKKLSADDIIKLFKEASLEWNKDSDLIKYKNEGLDFICTWINSGAFEENLNLSLRGTKHHLDDFCTTSFSNKRLMALPRGIVTHWLAGNVPTLGIISILISVVCKNTNIVKVTKNSLDVLQKMLLILSRIKTTSTTGQILDGKTITKAVKLIYIDKDSLEGEKLSMISDVRIAWGGEDAVQSIVNYPKKFTTEDIVFGPKLSLSAVGRESMEIERKVSRVARSIAVDSSIFDQKACASSHNVFIESGNVSSEIFLDMLRSRMEELSNQIPGNKFDYNNFERVRIARLSAYQDKRFSKIITSSNMKWTIFFDNELRINPPTYGRTLYIHEVNDLSDVASLLSSENQVIGLEIKSSRREEIAKLYLEKGVSRVSNIGHMADFTFPWDDIFPTEKLVRWCYA